MIMLIPVFSTTLECALMRILYFYSLGLLSVVCSSCDTLEAKPYFLVKKQDFLRKYLSDMLTYLVLEPNPQHCRAFLDIMDRHFSQVARLIGTHASAQSAVSAILAKKPDALFLDQAALTPHFLGFLQQLKPIPMTCALCEEPMVPDFLKKTPFILDALSKPLRESDCQAAVSRILAFQQYLLSNISAFQLDEHSRMGGGRALKVALPIAQGFALENIGDIVYCQGQVNYTKVVTNQQREIILPKTLKFAEAMLPKHLFARIHKSFLVNLDYVKGYYRAEGSYVELLDGTTLPVSHRKRDALVSKLVSKPFSVETGGQTTNPDEGGYIRGQNANLP